jgi:glycerol-3-phosphate dehydrogenase
MAEKTLPHTADSISRTDVLAALKQHPLFDIVVIGGGIHGAEVARLAAGLGFKTALLEKNDYAASTSSRSSKMAHGGLRYLELLDFEQVFEGIKAREEMFEHIGHLVRPEKFLIPVPRYAWLFRLKLSVGLFLYDLMVKKIIHRHRWIPRRKLTFRGFHKDGNDLMGCFMYTDGIMSDSRLVIENILAARRYGALCINYCEALTCSRDSGGNTTILARDTICEAPVELRTRLIINCSGPWTSVTARMLGAQEHRLKFSRGSHILFSKRWDGPSLFLPMPGKARYYFVWPHPAGTLVGTTEREISELELDPLPSHDETREIFDRIARDIPDAGLCRANAIYCFAGIRTLPLRGKTDHSTTLSRKHIWQHSNGVLSLFGGKYTTAAWTAREGIQQACDILGHPHKSREINNRLDLKKLPGSLTESERKKLSDILTQRGASEQLQARLCSRYGKRLTLGYSELFSDDDRAAIALEAEIALDTEQVETLDDLMRRRLELEYSPDHGQQYLQIIREAFRRRRPFYDIDQAIRDYHERLQRVQELLRSSMSDCS